jgi:hypothetical protein
MPLIPSVVLAPLTTPAGTAQFTLIELDSQITVAYDPGGHHLPPPFSHQVDDCFANTREHMHRIISLRPITLLMVLGFPDPRIPNPQRQHIQLHLQSNLQDLQ